MGCLTVMLTLRIRSIVWFATGIALTLIATLLVTQAWRVDAAPGDTDSTFVPVTPCRLFDTRPGEVPDGGKKSPLASGDGDALVQQVTGAVGDCVGIPAGATAVSMNVTIVNPTAQSNLRVFPDGVATPTVSNLNWLAGQSPTPNKVDVQLSPEGKIKLVNFNGTVDVIGDVVGYYINSTLKELADGLADANTKIALLEASEPFAIGGYVSPVIDLTLIPTSYVDVEVTAPVDGQVTVNYSTYVRNDVAGQRVLCAPYRSADIPDTVISASEQGIGFWETASAVGDQGSLSGTAIFEIAAGDTVSYSIACERQGGAGPASLRGRTMTAIFTPTL